MCTKRNALSPKNARQREQRQLEAGPLASSRRAVDDDAAFPSSAAVESQDALAISTPIGRTRRLPAHGFTVAYAAVPWGGHPARRWSPMAGDLFYCGFPQRINHAAIRPARSFAPAACGRSQLTRRGAAARGSSFGSRKVNGCGNRTPASDRQLNDANVRLHRMLTDSPPSMGKGGEQLEQSSGY